MLGPVVKTVLRLAFKILTHEAASASGLTGNRNVGGTFSLGLNIPLRTVSDTQEELLRRLGYRTRRFGPVVWIEDAPSTTQAVQAQLEMPPMWRRDP